MERRIVLPLTLAVIGLFLLLPRCDAADSTRDVASADVVEATDVSADACLEDTRCYGPAIYNGWCTLGQCADWICDVCVPYGGGGPCECEPDEICLTERQCGHPCVPECTGKQCGDDGCGGSCGQCQGCGGLPVPEACSNGHCGFFCCPDCVGKVCGDDGCGGTCGTCPTDEICGPGGTCTCACYGKATHVNALYLPSMPDETGADTAASTFPNLGGAACLDLNGDAVPDNALGSMFAALVGFGVDVNVELTNALADSSLQLLLDLGQDPEAGPFELNGYLGKPDANAGEYLVDPTSFVDGEAMIHFSGAEIVGGNMKLGPITMSLGALLEGPLASVGIPPFDITLDRVQLVATVDGAIDDAGIAFTNGTLAGAIFKADLDRALHLVRKWCAEDPQAPVDVCGYTSIAQMPPLDSYFTWDLDLPDCGKMLQIYDPIDPMVVVGEEDNCQAVSACLFWASEKAKIIGLAPTE